MVALFGDTETLAQHLFLAGSQIGQHGRQLLGQLGIDDFLGGGHGLLVLDEIAQAGIFLVADGRFQRDGFLGDLEHLLDLFHRVFHALGDLFGRGIAAQLLHQVTRGADDLVDGLLHPLQFPSCIHVPDADIGDGYSSCTYCQKKSHIDIHFKSILQDHQHDHTDDQCRKENDSHAPLVVHQILQLISPVFVGMSFSVQSVQILPYQIAVFLAVPNLLNAFFNLVLSFADRIEVRIPHTVLLFPVSAAFLFQPGQLAGHPVDLFSLLCWQCLNLIRIRQIRSHQRILSRQEVDLLGSL